MLCFKANNCPVNQLVADLCVHDSSKKEGELITSFSIKLLIIKAKTKTSFPSFLERGLGGEVDAGGDPGRT